MFMWWRAPVQAARVFPLVTCPKNMDKIRELLGLLLFVFVCWGGQFWELLCSFTRKFCEVEDVGGG